MTDLILALAERVFAQGELLARRAERRRPMSEPTRPTADDLRCTAHDLRALEARLRVLYDSLLPVGLEVITPAGRRGRVVGYGYGEDLTKVCVRPLHPECANELAAVEALLDANPLLGQQAEVDG